MKRRAFTLIEILVAVVILVILGGLMLYAIKGTATSAKTQATRVRLENLKSMLAEYELKTRFAQPASWSGGGNLWFTIDNATPPGSLPSPGNVRADIRSGWGSDPAAITVAVSAINELKKLPSNATALGKLPASEFIAGTSLMADGWGNPLIFVPGDAGLGIDRDNDGTYDVTVHAPNDRPFWASAGPDGDFTKDDDNLYSFEQ